MSPRFGGRSGSPVDQWREMNPTTSSLKPGSVRSVTSEICSGGPCVVQLTLEAINCDPARKKGTLVPSRRSMSARRLAASQAPLRELQIRRLAQQCDALSGRFNLLASQHLFQCAFCDRSAKQITLHLVAPQKPQELLLFFGFDAFGHDVEIKPVCE